MADANEPAEANDAEARPFSTRLIAELRAQVADLRIELGNSVEWRQKLSAALDEKIADLEREREDLRRLLAEEQEASAGLRRDLEQARETINEPAATNDAEARPFSSTRPRTAARGSQGRRGMGSDVDHRSLETEAKISGLEEEVARLEQRVNEVIGESEDLRRELAEANRQIGALERQVDEVERTAAERGAALGRIGDFAEEVERLAGEIQDNLG